MSHSFCNSKINNFASLDDPLQPSRLKQSPQTQVASSTDQGLSNATIRDLPAPSVQPLGAIEAEKAKIPANRGPESAAPTLISEFLRCKEHQETEKVQSDSSRHAGSNGDVRGHVISTVSEKKSEIGQIFAHRAPESVTNVAFGDFLGYKEPQKPEILQVDSLRHSESNGDVRGHTASTVSAIYFSVPIGKKKKDFLVACTRLHLTLSVGRSVRP